MKINQSRWVVSGILGWWMYKCSIILRGFVIPNRPFGGQIRWLELQMLSEMTRLTSCCSWSSCNSATTDSFLGEKYVRVKENTENPACLGPSIFLDAIAYLAFFSYHALFYGFQTHPQLQARHVCFRVLIFENDVACVSPNFKAIRGTSYLRSAHDRRVYWVSTLQLQSFQHLGQVGRWKPRVLSGPCFGSVSKSIYLYIYRHKANLIMQYLDFGSSPTRGDVLFSKQSRGVIGNHCAIWWYQRPISCFHRTADRGWDDLARPLWLA